MKAYSKQTFDEYYVDFSTENRSFLKIAALLEQKGIENCYFFLKLYNKKLKGVNPYDPDLSDDLKFQIFSECANNRWYFYREVFRVGETGSSTDVGGGCAFKLNRGNLAYLWAMELNISSYMILPRQTGKTWAATADSTWTHHFVRNSTILHFNKNQSDANMNLRRISEAIGMLPEWMQHSNIDNLDPSDKRRVKNNEKTIRNTLNSTIEAMASAGNEAKADALARGKTASKIWYDEMAFIFFNEAIYTAATPAYEKASEVAMEHGIPYAISITTTPGDIASPHGAFAKKMMDDAIRFDESMYDYKYKKLMDIIKNTPGKTDFLFIQFNHLQLGETDEWYRKRYKKMNNPLKARREYLLEWINSNGNSPFDPDDLELISDLARDRGMNYDIYKINKYFQFNVYSEYHGKKPVLIGVDVSSGLGRDSTAITVVNPETLMPMAFFKSNQIPSDALRKMLCTLVLKKYPNCVLTVENNSVGKPLLDELRGTPISRVLYRERKTRTMEVGASQFSKKRKIENVEFGHNVNPTTRAQMMEILMSVVHNSPSHFGFPDLYDELKLLELRGNRIDHSASTHDDLIMSYLGVLFIVRYGKGLRGKGIYYTLREEGDDYEEVDYSKMYRAADRAIRHDDMSDDEALLDFLSNPQPVETSGTVFEKEQREYFRELDRIEGTAAPDEDEVSEAINKIPDSTQRLLLKNYYSLFGEDDDGFTSDPFGLRAAAGYRPENSYNSYLDDYRF